MLFRIPLALSLDVSRSAQEEDEFLLNCVQETF